MDPIVLAAGTALVSAMATDGWQQVRNATVAWWRGAARADDDAEAVGADLDAVRPQIVTARQEGDEDTEQALIGAWRLRLQQLVRDQPHLAAELRRLVEEELTPALSAGERSRVGSIVMKARASGNARIYQAAGDQHITERATDVER
ncbi:hypothetical protein [Streptomyces sp. NBC_01803]|uniref:hypothetical protein n=1 Tax=Streptomyces sp. NBC_01803 TaxID=2975946 RepID=UPI002DDA5182|nr:hypothetical protein [Streptomyces sp. NBC_01803]WSA45461.1 hypothetical protein OIE51_15390 [Streptomyces sp. NBC_01803]